ncbi:NAD(P) transhydrogenase subunit alpha [Proteiniborus sp. MB09-C3]|uniref:NAD(P) transhydrogenase subunit alpha n=1 Tax=Proteiniborus sp. MB09-C3 TaxID=3050072 RepID=UPI0025534D3E|nr:NAD(P) transhydrogenase subunit alpha [Proteiniborus sp. MB09-C3]WIV11042.1 NAD(P) transhydrogenase subunit alpha [Proteiniborus sp. MB09-C3]
MSNVQFKGLTIGVPKEIMKGEKRVAATPETVEKMVQNGAVVLVEKGAGSNSLMADSDYEKVGAKIVDKVEELFNQSDIILKVKEPVFNSEVGKHEVDMLKKGQVLITFLHPAAPKNHEMIKSLAKSGATSLTLDGIPRISRAQTMDALTSMSAVAGYKSVLLAANKLAKFVPMTGTAVGMIQPAKVVVIGTGVAGLQAVSTAKRLGAIVTAVDIRPDAIEHSKSLGAKVLDPGVPADVAIGKGGYAKSLPAEWIEKERENIKNLITDADIVVATALVPGKLAPVLITEEMVKNMRPGSVIMDVAIDQGGNCELSESGVIAEHYGITVDGTNNIPGMVASSSTWMFSKNVYNLIAAFIKDGKFVIDKEDEIIASTLVTMDGELLHSGAREAMGLQ